jgi:Holliday junction resolvase RusA-like endonuclease
MAVGRPAPQGSKQLGGAGQLLEQSPYLAAWRRAVKIAAYEEYQRRGLGREHLPVFPAGTPVVVEMCTFWLAEDQCRAEGTDLPLGTPDIDKLLRSTLDALGGQRASSARLYADDSQVVQIRHLSKQRPTVPGGSTGVVIVVSDGRD